MVKCLFGGRFLIAVSLALPCVALAEDTFTYAVQLTATVSESPPKITLSWKADPYGSYGYAVYRKSVTSGNWGSFIATPAGSATSFQDFNVAVGNTYEYQVIKYGTVGYDGYGYIYTGIRAPATEFRGKLILVTATESVAGLDSEVSQLRDDLAGDGWVVLQKHVSSNDAPDQVRSQIRSEYLADPSAVRAVFLLGHVPVLHSGYLDYDGHLWRAMPADAYYGEMDDLWPTDPASSPSYMPSAIELMVGRVDFFDMPGAGQIPAWPIERELLRNYLNKDHAWRHGTLTVPRRALMGNRRGDEEGEATAASGYRLFEPIVGAGNTVEADTSDAASDYNRWINVLGRGEYLLAYGCGGGLPQGISWLGTHGPYKEAWSSDVVSVDAKAVFVMLFGSWFGEWDKEDNFMRSFLITSKGLGICMAGRPHWFAHHSALGEPFGYGARLTMNNSTVYRNQVNEETSAVYIAWLGDPTLRVDVVRPASGLNASRVGNNVSLLWTASPDASQGYYVFRATNSQGPFTRITSQPVSGTSFTDLSPPATESTYMVRAVKLENRFSGSYFNLSQGIVASAPLLLVHVARQSGGLLLTWSAVTGKTYHVETRSSLETNWVNASGPLPANSTTMSWSTNLSNGSGYFRLATP